MRTSKWAFGLLLIAFLGIPACSKPPPPPPQYILVSGVKVELPKLAAAFDSSPGGQRRIVNDVTMAIRTGQHENALAGLEKLSSDPAITPAQKEVVDQIIGQMKEAVEKAQAPAK